MYGTELKRVIDKEIVCWRRQSSHWHNHDHGMRYNMVGRLFKLNWTEERLDVLLKEAR